MEKLIIPLVVILVLGGGMLGDKSVNENEDFDYYLNPGEKMVVELKENPSTGFLWNYKVEPEGILELTSDRYESDVENEVESDISDDIKFKPIGGGGKHYWEFKAMKEGEVTLKFWLDQDWEGENIVKEKIYKIKVRSN